VRKKLILNPVDTSLEKLLELSRHFDPFICLNSNTHSLKTPDSYSSYDFLIAFGAVDVLNSSEDIFGSLKSFYEENKDWIFGYLSYDVKNNLENLYSGNEDKLNAPDYFFFRPRYIATCEKNELAIHYIEEFDTEKSVEYLLENLIVRSMEIPSIRVNQSTEREEYISSVNKIKKHIHLGDIYEMNYCMEFYNDAAEIDAVSVYKKLNDFSPMPFSAFMQIENISVMCASPERFIAKRGKKIISQPIKGTMKRGASEKEDEEIRQNLKNSSKEQSENVMIVDLVRNDLSRTAVRKTVKVEELFGIKTFRRLHQMESTIVSELDEKFHFTDAIRNAFPMGSMTGAPKIRAMEIIENCENMKRGIFSGTLGYVTPGGDFDFNVIIRSIFYNSQKKYLSFMAGSAITSAADAESEYEECLLKAESMKKILAGDY
jgi:para-aminobenzoate synthetase component 1